MINYRSSKTGYRLPIITAFLLLLSTPGSAQNIKVRGGFLTDSIRVGDETMFFLTARYTSTTNVLFPDTTFNFSPFEFKKKKYFTTHTRQGISYDSVLYYLTTFEIDSVQALSLPVFELLASDCTVYKSNRDSVFLSQIIKKLPDTITTNIPVRATVAYQDVSDRINLQMIILLILVLLISIAVIWIFFGKNIQKHFYLKRMRKTHQVFVKAYMEKIEMLERNFSADTTESALSIWKKYMEKLNGRPYTKLTAREILQSEKDEGLVKNLRTIDAAIYGHNTNVVNPLKNLRGHADQRFTKKVEEMKNG